MHCNLIEYSVLYCTVYGFNEQPQVSNAAKSGKCEYLHPGPVDTRFRTCTRTQYVVRTLLFVILLYCILNSVYCTLCKCTAQYMYCRMRAEPLLATRVKNKWGGERRGEELMFASSAPIADLHCTERGRRGSLLIYSLYSADCTVLYRTSTRITRDN